MPCCLALCSAEPRGLRPRFLILLGSEACRSGQDLYFCPGAACSGSGGGVQPSFNPHEPSPSLTTSACAAPLFTELGFKPGDQHVFDYWVQGFLMTVSNAPVCLSAFIRTSLQPVPLTAYKLTSVSDDIWPVPPPQRVRRWSAGKLGPRRRRRVRLASTAFNLLRVVVCCLNWLALGNPKAPPPEARVGAPITPEQSSVMDTLLRHVRHFVSTDWCIGPQRRKV